MNRESPQPNDSKLARLVYKMLGYIPVLSWQRYLDMDKKIMSLRSTVSKLAHDKSQLEDHIHELSYDVYYKMESRKPATPKTHDLVSESVYHETMETVTRFEIRYDPINIHFSLPYVGTPQELSDYGKSAVREAAYRLSQTEAETRERYLIETFEQQLGIK